MTAYPLKTEMLNGNHFLKEASAWVYHNDRYNESLLHFELLSSSSVELLIF